MAQLIRDMFGIEPLRPDHAAWRRMAERNARREVGDFILATLLGVGLALVMWGAWQWGQAS